MRRTTLPEQVLLETDRALSAEAAQEIKDAWQAWQAVARRYDVTVRPLDRTLILPGYDVKRRESSDA